MTSHDPSAGVPDGAAPAARGRRSPKIRDRHLDLLAVVYIRQSSPQQVLDHKESRERQYELVDHALALGWPADRVLVIDDDQGRAAQRARPAARLPAAARRGHDGPRRVGPGAGDEPPLADVPGLAPPPGGLLPSSARSWPIRMASMTPTTPTTGSCSA